MSSSRRVLSGALVTILLCGVPGATISGVQDSALSQHSQQAQQSPTAVTVVPPYLDLLARQNSRLGECRLKLNPEFDFDRTGEFGPYVQGIALICELAAQERGLGDNPPPGPVPTRQIAPLIPHPCDP